ncbi:hypothetical protein H5410_007122 [Solanum commersonii]|uniref:Uncharacterized protein n=1 Tax=Solanum commersonii TaxID=4109 RepID=A0A9J6ABL8_SOLCO|nr:hypothetical protein H5410_007122 [Solanum commersonii]
MSQDTWIRDHDALPSMVEECDGVGVSQLAWPPVVNFLPIAVGHAVAGA